MSEFMTIETTDDPYTIVPNFIIDDPEWCNDTKMTWIYLFSKRRVPGWKVRPLFLQKVLKYSARTWRKIYTNLYEGGYLSVSKTQEGTTIKFIYDWSFKNVDKPVDN